MISAVVLAAGLSTRMGRSKPLLAFGDQTVVEHIVAVLRTCPVDEILVITGHEREAVERCLAPWPVRVVFNPDYATGEMLTSLQVGLQSAAARASGALVVLGDQPALERSVVERIVEVYRAGEGKLVIPSYDMRRGHPLLVDRHYWADILALQAGQTLRDFFKAVGPLIHHVAVTTPTVLRDMDTPADYERELAAYFGSTPNLIGEHRR